MNITDFEIMAPVGSYESLTAAIQGGANSVDFVQIVYCEIIR